MTLQKFAIFAAVVRHRSLTKASEDLAICEPSVSLHLKELQQHYGTQLFRRASKGVVITAEGHAFWRRIIPILNQIAALEMVLGPSRRVRLLKCSGSAGRLVPSTLLLPKLLARIRQRYPGGEFEIRTRTSDQLERQLSYGQLDLAVLARVPPSAALVAEPLRQEKIAVCCS